MGHAFPVEFGIVSEKLEASWVPARGCGIILAVLHLFIVTSLISLAQWIKFEFGIF